MSDFMMFLQRPDGNRMVEQGPTAPALVMRARDKLHSGDFLVRRDHECIELPCNVPKA